MLPIECIKFRDAVETIPEFVEARRRGNCTQAAYLYPKVWEHVNHPHGPEKHSCRRCLNWFWYPKYRIFMW